MNYKNLFFLNKNYSKVFFSFFFVSLISPNFIFNFTNFFSLNPNLKKIQLKNSYILFTWFYYLYFVTKKKNKKIKIFVLPLKKKILTNTKAPIAHKTWSKEQFNYQFYLFRLSFKSSLSNHYSVSSVNSGLLFVILSKKYFPFFETNILFLKSYFFFFFFIEKNYFNYFKKKL